MGITVTDARTYRGSGAVTPISELEEGAQLLGTKCTTKEEAMRFGCPECNAAPGDRCVEADEVTWRRSLHGARHGVAIEAGCRVRYIGGAKVLYADDMARRRR